MKDFKIKADYMPINTASRPGYKLNPKFITVHNVGARSTAKQGRDFFKRNADKYVSVHYFVDDKDIIQMIPLNEVSWHAGDGIKGRGNRESISIEVCEVNDQFKANKNAQKLCKHLLSIYKYIPIVPHKYWIDKECPRLLLPKWKDFLKGVYDV